MEGIIAIGLLWVIMISTSCSYHPKVDPIDDDDPVVYDLVKGGE